MSMCSKCIGKQAVINNIPITDRNGKILGLKEGCGETGLIVDFYSHENNEYYVIDMGHGNELHFTREHFNIV